jgi:hypothetical protein
VLNASYRIVWESPGLILLEDLTNLRSTRSITNDARAVLEDLVLRLDPPPNVRVLYADSDLVVDEIVHDSFEFVGIFPFSKKRAAESDYPGRGVDLDNLQ